MNCPKCNADVTLKMSRCNVCGQKLDVFGKVMRSSNAYYNAGLEQAKVKDLSGAIRSLKQSLKLNKYNTNARNLLALIYYEIGEAVEALNEWVVSSHLQPEENVAFDYIEMVQSNPVRLEAVNQAIRKYNAALEYAKQGNEDLAIIQLKKVASLNPKFIRAGQLLALLYMRTGAKGKAMRCLMQIRKVDVNNTTTLRYMEELQDARTETLAATDEAGRPSRVFRGEPVTSIMPVDSYKEEKPRILPFINVLVGFVLGILVMLFLVRIRPSNDKGTEKQAEQIKTYGEQLASKDSRIASLENDVKMLNEQLTEYASREVEGGEPATSEAPSGDDAASVESYDALLGGMQLYMEDKKLEAARMLLGVNEAALGDTAKATYQTIKEDTFEEASAGLWEQGRDTYNAGKYKKARTLLEEALELKPDNVDALYFMGRLFHRRDDKEKAAEYYNKVIDDFPEHARASEARSQLSALGIAEGD